MGIALDEARAVSNSLCLSKMDRTFVGKENKCMKRLLSILLAVMMVMAVGSSALVEQEEFFSYTK